MKPKIKIDFLAPPFEGHLNPLVELAKIIRDDKKYEIRFITGKDKNLFIEKNGFYVKNILVEENEMFEKISNTDKQVKTNIFELKKQFSYNLELIPKATEELKKLFEENNTDIIVSDFTVVSSVFCSKDMGIPVITVMPTSFAVENRDGTPAYFGGLKPLGNIYGKLRDYLARKQIRTFKKIIYYTFYSKIKKMNFKLYDENGYENLYSKYSIIGLGMKEFEYKRNWPVQYIFSGYCCEEEVYKQEIKKDKDKISVYLGNQKYKRRVLVSLGTHLKWAKKNLVQDMKKITEEFKDTLFIITLGEKENNNSEDGFIYENNNLAVADYISYGRYFKEFDYIIHHGGAGITYNCIKYQKPSLVIPHDYDQYDFAARIEYFDIGIKAKNIKNTKDIIKKLEKLFEIEEWKNLKKLSKKFEQYKPELILEAEINRLFYKN